MGQQQIEVDTLGKTRVGTVGAHGTQDKPLMRRSRTALAEELQNRADATTSGESPGARADALIQLEQESVVQNLDQAALGKTGKKLLLNDQSSYAITHVGFSSLDQGLADKAATCVTQAVPGPCGQAKVSTAEQQSGGAVISSEVVQLKLDSCDVLGSDQKWQLEGQQKTISYTVTNGLYVADPANTTSGRIKLDGVNLCLYAESGDAGVIARGCDIDTNQNQYQWRLEKASSTIMHEHTSTGTANQPATKHCLAVCTPGEVGCTTDAQKSSLYLKECSYTDCNQRWSLAEAR